MTQELPWFSPKWLTSSNGGPPLDLSQDYKLQDLLSKRNTLLSSNIPLSDLPLPLRLSQKRSTLPNPKTYLYTPNEKLQNRTENTPGRVTAPRHKNSAPRLPAPAYPSSTGARRGSRIPRRGTTAALQVRAAARQLHLPSPKFFFSSNVFRICPTSQPNFETSSQISTLAHSCCSKGKT